MNYYHIGYTGGGYGKLIATLLMWLVEKIDRPMRFDRNIPYSAHTEWEYYEKFLNFDKLYHNQSNLHAEDIPWEYLKLSSPSPYKNIYFPGVPPIDYSNLIKTYPNFKNINIIVNKDEIIYAEINHYLKAGDHGIFSEELLSDFKNKLKDLSVEQRNNIISLINPTPIHYDRYMVKYNSISEEIKKHIANLAFFDIVMNPKKVLDVLSWAAECPITDVVEDAYYEYIESQVLFYRKYVPWHPLFISSPEVLSL